MLATTPVPSIKPMIPAYSGYWSSVGITARPAFIITLMIAGYILWQSVKEGKDVVRMLMLGAPTGIDRDALIDELSRIEGIHDVHHVHVWEIEEQRRSLEAHLVIGDAHWSTAERIKINVRALLKERYRIDHSTLELERIGTPCG